MLQASGPRPFRRAAQWEDRFWRSLEGAVPQDVRLHLRNARTEILRAVKAAVDEVVVRSEGAGPRRPRGSRRPDL